MKIFRLISLIGLVWVGSSAWAESTIYFNLQSDLELDQAQHQRKNLKPFALLPELSPSAKFPYNSREPRASFLLSTDPYPPKDKDYPAIQLIRFKIPSLGQPLIRPVSKPQSQRPLKNKPGYYDPQVSQKRTPLVLPLVNGRDLGVSVRAGI